jgi:hypothetical protein
MREYEHLAWEVLYHATHGKIMNPFEFGRLIKLATDGISPAPTSFFQSWLNPPKPAASSGAPTSSPYLNTLDRWYNPGTKQQVTEKGETSLMRAGQTALGTGAAAGAVAGGIAAAPALAAAGNTAMTSAGAASAAIGSQAPKVMNTLNNAAGQITAKMTPQTAQSFQSADTWVPASQNTYGRTTNMFGLK